MTRFELRTQKLVLIGLFLILHAICRQRVKKTSLIEVAGRPIDPNADQIEATGDEIAWFKEWQQHMQLVVQAETEMMTPQPAPAEPENPDVLHQVSPQQ